MVIDLCEKNITLKLNNFTGWVKVLELYLLLWLYWKKLYGIYLTSDSSEIIRFAPIAQKLPLLKKEVHYNEDTEKYHNDFDFARTPVEVLDMLDFHSWDDDHCPRASRDIFKKFRHR